MELAIAIAVGTRVGSALGWWLKGRPVAGAMLGLFLNCFGWVAVIFLEERPRCRECRAWLDFKAVRCPRCGVGQGPNRNEGFPLATAEGAEETGEWGVPPGGGGR
jgi:hypothetical protein